MKHYNVLLNGKPSDPAGPFALNDAKVASIDLILALTEGDFFHHFSTKRRHDGNGYEFLVHHHGGIDIVSVEEA